MRKSTWIILLLFIVIIGAFFLFQKKKQEEMQKEIEEPNVTPHRTPVSDPGVKRLQEWVNSQLPDDYPKLAEDGIMGPKTQAAIDYLQKNDAENSTVQKIVEVAATMSSPVATVAKTEYDLAKKAWNWLFK